MKTIGVTPLLIGLLIAIASGVQLTAYEIMQVPPQQLNHPNKTPLYWSPITAIALIIAGFTILFLKRRERKINYH